MKINYVPFLLAVNTPALGNSNKIFTSTFDAFKGQVYISIFLEYTCFMWYLPSLVLNMLAFPYLPCLIEKVFLQILKCYVLLLAYF